MGDSMRDSCTFSTPRLPARAARSARLARAALWWVAVLSITAAVAAEARVKITTRADDRRVIYDESATYYGQRTASSLLSPKGGISELIDHYAQDRGLSPKLVQAVIQVESGYNPNALSSKGAMGLMQLMPGTAKLLRVSDPWDPAQNIRGGTLYLRRQLDRFSGDLTLALAAYNAGPAAVTQYGDVPPYTETRNYVRKVLTLYRGQAPAALQEHARDQARQRSETERKVAAQQTRGGKVYMSRGKGNRMVFTSAPPRTP